MSYSAALTDPEFETPGKSKGLFGVFRYRYLLSLLLKKGVATRYHGSVLGWVWSYVRPGAQFLMYFLVIGLVLGQNRGIQFFPVYLFSGIVAVNLFNEALRNTTTAITDNASLIKKVYLPRALFPVSAVGVALIHFLPQALLLLVVALFCGWTIGWLQVITFIVGVAVILCFSLGLGLFFGAINVAYRDARNFVDLILMFATWASPVLYSWTMVYEHTPGWLYNIYMSNPMTVAVEMFHDAFWLPLADGSPRPDGLLTFTLVGAVLALLTLFIGQLVFRRLEGSFAQNL
ncbi:ABC transporter permease [Leucobacter triazinivorans]|uniref:Transport permease protein n=1 Tax=Leucobacter triazinivorans TaxID=1784719 RepID=A0A4P6KGQ3_9MICO|nr:ABC transporter permease [Leucobacter triazinivorans]QBE49413.1 ABC transporter permease [Leucobacter triazinivorans]